MALTKKRASKSSTNQKFNPRQLESDDVMILLKEVVLSSLQAENYSVALKALELWGKHLGLFCQKKNFQDKKKLSDYSTEELQNLLTL